MEISTKSTEEMGRTMSAYMRRLNGVLLECVFQGGMTFRSGGPYLDLYEAEPKDAKRDPRLQSSGPLVCFQWNGQKCPLTPRTAFYDALYMQAALQSIRQRRWSS